MARLSHARRPHVEVPSRQRRGPSRAELAIIEAASRTRIMLSSIDDWLARQPLLIDRRRRALLPVLKERGQPADCLVRHLQVLGIKRSRKDLDGIRALLTGLASSALLPPVDRDA